MKEKTENCNVLYSTKTNLVFILSAVLAGIVAVVAMYRFWDILDWWIKIILIGMMVAGILSVIFAISWYRLDPDGITKCTYFYKKTFAWCEIQDIYLTTYDTMKNSGGTVECVVLSKEKRHPRLSYEAANSFTHRDCAMAFALNSTERKANIFVPYIDKAVFLDFAARRGLTISNL